MRASESCLERNRLVDFPVRIWNHPVTTLGNLYCRIFHRSISRPNRGGITAGNAYGSSNSGGKRDLRRQFRRFLRLASCNRRGAPLTSCPDDPARRGPYDVLPIRPSPLLPQYNTLIAS